jgi:glycosyltransferase involved in cell wall biosynthesis
MPRREAVAIALGGCDFGNSGVSVFAQALLPRLVDNFRSQGRDVIVLGTALERASAGLTETPGRVLPALLNVPGLSAGFSLALAGDAARRQGAGVLYLPCANRRIAGVSPIPVVGTVHDLAQFHVRAKYGLLVPLLRRLRLVTAVSRATADDIVKYAGVPRERIRVIPNGISMTQPALGSVPPARPYFLCAARLEHPGKNHLRLVEAFAHSRALRTHDLVLSGADWGAQALIVAKLAELGIADRVQLLGFIGRNEFAVTMGNCDAVVAPGLCEGFGLPAAEGMLCGKVVVASNAGSLPEVVGDMGVLFDPLDTDAMTSALDRAVSDQQLRERCRSGGPLRAGRFSWDSAARDTASALEEALHAAA